MRAKYLLTLLAVFILHTVVTRPSASAQATDWKQIHKPPLHEFHPQEPKRILLANGMVVFLEEDHELPLLAGTARIRGGGREIAAEKVGLIGIYGQTWRTGGTKTKTGDQFDDQLEALAAKVETSGGLDSTSISFNCLKQDFDAVFAAFNDLLRNPEFREDKLELAKKREYTVIQRRNDDSDEIASRESTKIGYGTQSPYARVPEYYTVNAVTREDLVNWHKEHVHPNNIIFGVVGDFDSKQMEAKLRQSFGSWPKGPAAKKVEVQFKDPRPGIYLVEKDDVNQSEIRMVALGIRRDNPDYFAIQVMNEVFGGGFASRLFTNVRSKQGLAYEVGGGVGSAFDHPGLLRITMGTKSQSTVQAIHALYHEVDDIVQNPPTQAEMQRAKDSILNSFIFNFDSKSKVLTERMAYEFYGYPADFLERYRAGIEKVSIADVAAAAKRHVEKGKLAVLIVGKTSDFDKPLTTLGTVTNVDISIRESAPGTATTQSGAAAASAKSDSPATGNSSSNAEGKALVLKVVNAFGGVDKLKKVTALERKISNVQKTPQGDVQADVDIKIVFPDKMRNDINAPQGQITMVMTPQYGYMQGGGMSQPLPQSMLDDALNSLKRTPFSLASHLDDPNYTFTASGSETIGDVRAKIIDISANGTALRWYVDPNSGRLLKVAYKSVGMRGPADRMTEYSDWRPVEGLMLPYKEVTSEGGEHTSDTQVSEIKINPAIDAKAFDKPADLSQPK